MKKELALKNIKTVSTTLVGKLNRQIDKISPKGENDDKYNIVGGKHPIAISRHAFVYILIIITAVTLLLTFIAYNKVVNIEENETGFTHSLPVRNRPQAESEAEFQFSKKAIISRYTNAFDTFNQDLYQEAIQLISGCQQSPICYIIAIYQYITNNFICEKDIPVGNRPLKKPIETWIDKKGGTEDLAVMLATMVYSFGYESSICVAPNEAFVSFQNFNEDEFYEVIHDKYRDNLAYIKKTTIRIGRWQEHEILITDDFRYSPLTLELSATFPVKLSTTSKEQTSANTKRKTLTYWETELLNSGTEYNNDITAGNDTKIIITGTQDNTIVTYCGYRKEDKKVTEYIREIININRNSNRGNYNQFGLFFGMDKVSLPGMESKYIRAMQGTGIIIEASPDLMSKRFMKQENSFTVNPFKEKDQR